MKKTNVLLGVVIALIFIFALSACGTKTIVVEKSPDTTQEPVATNAPQSSGTLGEDAYIESVAGEYPEVMQAMGKKWVIEFGYIVCDSIDDGLTFDDLLAATLKTGADSGQIGFMTGAAIMTLCPENKWFIDSLN